MTPVESQNILLDEEFFQDKEEYTTNECAYNQSKKSAKRKIEDLLEERRLKMQLEDWIE